MKGDNRKIATILAADVVGYSRLMEQDEEATLAMLKATRGTFRQLVEQFGGMEFGSVGDSLMAQFPSAVNAVRCARAIQDSLTAENIDRPPGRRMDLRMGINLGDVIEEAGTLYGDGVNVAARIQEYAAPGKILITGAVHEQTVNKIETGFRHAGQRYFKNINHPVELFEDLPGSDKRRFNRISIFRRHFTNHPVAGMAVIILITITLVLVAESKINGNKPPSSKFQNQIAVLPFVNLSNDSTDDWLGRGLSEDVLNLLAQIKELKVVSRTSSFQTRLQSMDIREIGRQLDAHYILEGSVRHNEQDITVVAQLNDADTGYHLASQKFERQSSDIFTLQSEIVDMVVKSLKLTMPADFHLGYLEKPTKNVQAYDYYLQAKSLLEQTTSISSLQNAEKFFQHAIQIDPKFGFAYAGLCRTLSRQIEHQHSLDVLKEAESACATAMKLAPDSYQAHAAMGELYKLKGENEKALLEYTWVVEHKSDDLDTRLGIAGIYVQTGDLDAADRAYRDAIKIGPSYSPAYEDYGKFLFNKGDIKEAINIFKRLIQLEPGNVSAYDNLGSAYGMAGEFVKASNAYRKVLTIKPTQVAYTNIGTIYYYQGKYSEAEAMQRAAIALSKDRYELWGNLGDTLLQIPEKKSQALRAYQKARLLTEKVLDVNPNQGYVLALRAHYCAELNDKECAKTSIEKALHLSESDLYVQFCAALVNLYLGNTQQATLHLDKVIDDGFPKSLLNADPLLAPLHGKGKLAETDPQGDKSTKDNRGG